MIKTIIGDYNSFLDKIFLNMKNAGFEDGEFSQLDHLAYRTQSNERYEELKKELATFACDFKEVFYNGRNITIYKLKDPLKYKQWQIECLELFSPKENNKFEEGLEHAEFVTKDSLDEFMKKHSEIEFNMKGFSKETNRELIVEFENSVVKFHEQNLLE